MPKFQVTLLSLLCYAIATAQPGNVFYTYDTLPFTTQNGTAGMPFTGGFNAPQFSRFDVNNDGVIDLIVFDRNDNKVLPFIKKNGEWVYDSKYEKSLPTGFFWYKTADLNSDGKWDVFTLTETSTLLIYLNDTRIGDVVPRFKFLGEQFFRNKYDTNFFQLFNPLGLSKLDLPEISDLDNDGDLDIVFYDQFAKSYSMHRDVRAEKGWPKDTFQFQIMDMCFGGFNEGFDNSFLLGECSYRLKLRPRHAGGAGLLMFDNDEDGDYEMLVSNIGFKGMTLLKNGKKDFNTYYDTMIAVDTIFPKNTKRAATFVFPAAYLFDENGDGLNDLIIAPNGFSDQKETNNIWLYRNSGKNNKPIFTFERNNFLASRTLDFGAKSVPTFCDYDADGDQDLFVASNGDFEVSGGLKDRITLFENQGNSSRANFVLKDTNYLNFTSLGLKELVVRFGDLDGDKDIDLYYGNNDGSVGWFKNTAGPGKPLNLISASASLPGIIVNWGMSNSAPAIYNYNNDTLPDLLVGMYNGRIALYVNNGSVGAPAYTLASERAWGMRANQWRTDVTPIGFQSFGYAVPEVVDIDNDGKEDILVGCSHGEVRLYSPAGRSIYDSLSAKEGWLWQRTVGDSMLPDFGSRVSIGSVDLNRDSIPEIMVGNSRGGLYLLKNPKAVLSGTQKLEKPEKPLLYPNPAWNQITIARKGTNNECTVMLTDLTGRKYRESRLMKGEKSIGFDLQGCEPGVYFVSLTTQNGTSAEKLVIVSETR